MKATQSTFHFSPEREQKSRLTLMESHLKLPKRQLKLLKNQLKLLKNQLKLPKNQLKLPKRQLKLIKSQLILMKSQLILIKCQLTFMKNHRTFLPKLLNSNILINCMFEIKGNSTFRSIPNYKIDCLFNNSDGFVNQKKSLHLHP
jgi:hypothetical protein